MLLDPFTIFAQIFNFAILVVALKHFLYDRVIEAMDAREASIAARLDDAEQRESSAAQEVADYERRRRELEGRERELLDEAQAEADRHRKGLLNEARTDVDAQRQRWEAALRAEKLEIEDELRQRTAAEVVALSRQFACVLRVVQAPEGKDPDTEAGPAAVHVIVDTTSRVLARLDADGLGTDEPIATRSFIRVVMATRQPWRSFPSICEC